MSDKNWTSLLRADRLMRQMSPNKGMNHSQPEEPQIRVTLIRGFELFNTRPYHNYETWSDGYVAEAFGENGEVIASVRAEDLDVALTRLKQSLNLRQAFSFKEE
jgi:hypothetical protein